MEEQEKKLNMKKVLITIFVIVLAFIIILASAIITIKANSNKENDKIIVSNENVNSKNIANSTEKKDTENVQNTNSTKTNDKNTIKNNTHTTLPVYNPDSVQLIKDIYSSNEKNIYLTFDDGPSPNVTPQILQILKEEKVPATFFVLGSRVELYPNILKQEFEEGHYIGNHGYSHSYSSIYTSVDTVVDEYNRTETAIQNALGNSDFHSYLFRFPGGSSGGRYHSLKQEAKQHLNNIGIASTNWNCLTGDSEGGKRTVEQLLNRLNETAVGYDSYIILMHDADDKQTTADALRTIIQNYKQQGYTFKNFYEIFHQ